MFFNNYCLTFAELGTLFKPNLSSLLNQLSATTDSKTLLAKPRMNVKLTRKIRLYKHFGLLIHIIAEQFCCPKATEGQ